MVAARLGGGKNGRAANALSLGAGPSPGSPAAATAQKDVTGALRARRYRQKKRKSKSANKIKASVTVMPPLVAPAICAPPEVPAPSLARAMRRQAGTAVGVGAVAVILTALSLSHLAHGIGLVTRAAPVEAWAMAIGIDLGFVALEISQLATVSDKVRQQVSRFARPAIWGTLAGSAAMNGFAFAAQADGLIMRLAAIALGVAVPALVYALTRVGAGLWIGEASGDCHARSA
jgi:hypothetical protein